MTSCLAARPLTTSRSQFCRDWRAWQRMLTELEAYTHLELVNF